jgi:hypothetical protein
MLPVRIVLYWFGTGRITSGEDRIVAKFLHFQRKETVKKQEGPDRNPGPLKIQYPMKNRYTNGVRGS